MNNIEARTSFTLQMKYTRINANCWEKKRGISELKNYSFVVIHNLMAVLLICLCLFMDSYRISWNYNLFYYQFPFRSQTNIKYIIKSDDNAKPSVRWCGAWLFESISLCHIFNILSSSFLSFCSIIYVSMNVHTVHCTLYTILYNGFHFVSFHSVHELYEFVNKCSNQLVQFTNYCRLCWHCWFYPTMSTQLHSQMNKIKWKRSIHLSTMQTSPKSEIQERMVINSTK